MNSRLLYACIACMGFAVTASCSKDLPEYPKTEKAVWLEQNWTGEQREWFHHANQGTWTFFIPYEWFMALEQPGFKLFGEPGLLSDTDYLRRLGFIPGEAGEHNKAGLPVGFAVDYGVTDPLTGKVFNSVGLTCAACHTGQMSYKGTSIRYDGGPGMINPNKLMEILFRSMLETEFNQRQFNRFAARILGAGNTDAARAELKKEYSRVFTGLIKHLFTAIKLQSEQIIDEDIAGGRESVALRDIADNVKANFRQTEGFGRTDALNRIGNQVFSLDAGKPENMVVPDAPVSFPFIWSSSWFVWVQYDGSIMQPMIRNAGEALGVGAFLRLDAAHPENFASSVQIRNLHEIENLLSGPEPAFEVKRFSGLQAPAWPEAILGNIDRARAEAGAKLYQQHCQHCHLPPPHSDEFWSQQYWSVSNRAGMRLLDLPLVPADEIGTDPQQSRVLAERTVDTTGLGIDTSVFAGAKCEPLHVGDGTKESFAFALGAVVQQTVNHWYDANNTPQEERDDFNVYLPNCLEATRAYKARPLNGIWATAPYLHNGSVPNLYALLSPADERPARFYTGHLEFDPTNVGYETGKQPGLFLFDTEQNGNSNKGHEFSDRPGKGVIGPALSVEDRKALVEFLKTL
ncbi:MAG TPA: di-heme-cytochrome C peroxidase [Gammaproteobacteria bacterium]|nr:di-heme-cytochrome C peroxidase [Gammaproteobacteria bacterium]